MTLIIHAGMLLLMTVIISYMYIIQLSDKTHELLYMINSTMKCLSMIASTSLGVTINSVANN